MRSESPRDERTTKRPAPAAAPPSRRIHPGKTVAALVSVIVLCVTGYAWGTLNDFTTDDVTEAQKGPKPLDGALDILMVGLDSRTDAQGNELPPEVLRELHAGGSNSGGDTTDSMILMHIPVDGKPVGISLPRDSYVEIAGGFGKHKINAAYSFNKVAAAKKLRAAGKSKAEVEQESTRLGRKGMIDTVGALTGVTIDHYAEVNLASFYEITKAIGGVEVCLKAATKDNMSGANFPKGVQTIQGAQALAFVRQRHGLPSDLDRIVRQQTFLKAMAKKITSAGTLTDPGKLTGLVNAVKKSVVVDKYMDLLQFAQQMQPVMSGGVEFKTIPIEGDIKTDDGLALKVNPKEVKDFVANQTKEQPPASSTPPPAGGGDTKSITVEVRNATGASGLANDVLDALVAKGFGKGNVDNAVARAKTVVRYSKGQQDFGKKVVDAIGGNAVLEEDKDRMVPPGTVRLFIGKDYSGPGKKNTVAGDRMLELGGIRPAAPNQSATPETTPDGIPCIN
ncbi:LCP family protein [Allokutzneria albata]|uniref:Cell envelope-related function transcriptional attenuator common domain-containing protein n=1 Tax=Allokutzneria albata TaxID=211114 RepID=A0A1H0BDE7_ALLAB|nr:LCP family protein [Allokutzneria albata]SDN43648.1 cell envelope-related function transcriptional attenuator common domain-containing protein [Allokutzneria albata]